MLCNMLGVMVGHMPGHIDGYILGHMVVYTLGHMLGHMLIAQPMLGLCLQYAWPMLGMESHSCDLGMNSLSFLLQ